MINAIIVLAFVTFFSTLVGGAIAIKLKNKLPFFFAFASGSLIAVSFFDLIPESIGIANSITFPIRFVMIAIVSSFLISHILERYFLTHHHDDDSHGHIMGPIGAGSLIIHSFLDGIAIGAASQVNFITGIIVGFAVIFHDFTDGMNTVTLMLKNHQHTRKTVTFLIFDAIAPVLGFFFASLVLVDQNTLSLLLAVFAGEFIYIGASNLLPETYKHGSALKMTLSMLLGVSLILLLSFVIPNA